MSRGVGSVTCLPATFSRRRKTKTTVQRNHGVGINQLIRTPIGVVRQWSAQPKARGAHMLFTYASNCFCRQVGCGNDVKRIILLRDGKSVP